MLCPYVLALLCFREYGGLQATEQLSLNTLPAKLGLTLGLVNACMGVFHAVQSLFVSTCRARHFRARRECGLISSCAGRGC